MRIGIYVDGFNYYYAVFKDPKRPAKSHKWLDIRRLAEAIAHEHGFSGTCAIARYCTAIVNDPAYDPARIASDCISTRWHPCPTPMFTLVRM